MTSHMASIDDLPGATKRRLLALVGAFALLFTLVVPYPQASAFHGEGAINDAEIARFAGENRHDTACLIATATFDTSDTVIITRADAFPDTLSGNYLAGQLGIPVLITAGPDHPNPDEVDPITAECLEDLGVESVIILGGPAAVSPAVEAELDEDFDVERIGGVDRHETAKLVAEAGAEVVEVGETALGRTAIVARADLFVDALVAGGAAYDGDFPVLLTPVNELDDFTEEALDELEIDHVLISGGPAAVSEAVELQINAMGITTERVAGDNRLETATEWADWGVDNLDWTRSHVNLARADTFPDALTMGPHAGDEQAGLVLNWNPTTLGAETDAWLEEHACEILGMHIAGGTAAVSAEVEAEAKAAADDCPVGEPSSISIEPQDATNIVGTDHTVTVTVTDANGIPVPGTNLLFEVERDGAVEETDTATTDGAGQATFTYTGPAEPAEDTIFVCTNPDGTAPETCVGVEVVDFPTPTNGLVVTDLRDEDLTPEDLANALAGPGVTVDNVEYTGAEGAAGLYVGGGGIIGIARGVVMGSGDVQDVIGPNTEPDTSTAWGTPGHPTLDELAEAETFDAAILEFDFVSDTDFVRFEFVFSSEEYNEFVGSEFNDVFALEINGDNCALTPPGAEEPGLPISINTINNGQPEVEPTNPGLYINNDPHDEDSTGTTVAQADLLDTEMDGLTVVLACEESVQPGATNTAWFGIADAADTILDSNVFIGALAAIIVDTAHKSWVEDPELELTLEPEESTNEVGEDHTVTATVTENGEPVEGAEVLFEVTGTHPQEATATTDADGEATFTYTGDTEGTDDITACTNEDGSLPDDCDTATGPSDDAVKHWVDPDPELQLFLEPEESTNVVGEDHTVTATVNDEDGPVEGAEVLIEIDGAHDR
jgi:hypothetical protein